MRPLAVDLFLDAEPSLAQTAITPLLTHLSLSWPSHSTVADGRWKPLAEACKERAIKMGGSLLIEALVEQEADARAEVQREELHGADGLKGRSCAWVRPPLASSAIRVR